MVIKICVDLRNVKRINYKYVVLLKMSVIIDTHVFSEYMLTLCFRLSHILRCVVRTVVCHITILCVCRFYLLTWCYHTRCCVLMSHLKTNRDMEIKKQTLWRIVRILGFTFRKTTVSKETICE